ncbi:hypothetical protein EW146_g4451 [Bondarzewia mesenterica]|uniref:DUF4218 domain-containing protein n=1 Tax=Bondarzewia mesenterica TaxID=1095465 RepID=A0A4S4LUH3_9AGAM|nr:hypothetical protein EW146_g4451 [Bondarzewia mesenterica]
MVHPSTRRRHQLLLAAPHASGGAAQMIAQYGRNVHRARQTERIALAVVSERVVSGEVERVNIVKDVEPPLEQIITSFELRGEEYNCMNVDNFMHDADVQDASSSSKSAVPAIRLPNATANSISSEREHDYWHTVCADDDSSSEDEFDGLRPFDSDSDSDVEDSFRDLAPDDPFLSAMDQLGENFEQMTQMNPDDLSNTDNAILRQYSLKLRSHMTDKVYRALPSAFPDSIVPSLESARSHIACLAGFKLQIYDCCINSCCCYTGPHASLDICLYCKAPRYDAQKCARKCFTYLPLIPRLQAFAASQSMATSMCYRAYEHEPSPGQVSDIFDSKHYRRLCRSRVVIDSKELPHNHFSDARDIALGLSTDGFAPFHRRKTTCWPLILFNYNLPLEIRFHIEHILSLGVIPRPKKPHDFDSFLWPFIEEMIQLVIGVRAFDSLSQSLFALRAFLILIFGDILAISAIICMKGHNGWSPCCICKIVGLRIPNSRATMHYVPLDRSNHPDVHNDSNAVQIYDALNLPLRTHQEILQMAHEVQSTPTITAMADLAKCYDIKGVSILSHLSSISFSKSFPYDFMHLIWENTIKNLILLWTASFKNLDEGVGSYHLENSVWEAISAVTALSGSIIPGCFGGRVSDVVKDRTSMTADTWSFWSLYIGPVLLCRKFHDVKYYNHFIALVKLLHTCLQFTITSVEISVLREGFAKWVQRFEELYYQKEPQHIATCPVTIHALLHIADSIEACGPVWAYWAFPMERYCSLIRPAIKSRKHPFASLD